MVGGPEWRCGGRLGFRSPWMCAPPRMAEGDLCYNALGKMDPKRLLPIGAQAKKRFCSILWY